MAISVISFSSDSLEENYTPASPDYTPVSPDYSPASDTEFDPSEDPSSDPSGALHRRVMILAPGQPIPCGRSYRYHPNGPVHMMTTRKRVGPLPTHPLAVRHLVGYSSLDLFTFDDSSETSSDSSLDDLSDSSSGHSSSDHSSPALPSGMRSSHQLCSSVPSIPHSPTVITERPSHSSFAGPSRKRSSYESSVPRETSLRDDVVVRGSDEPYSEPDIDPEIQAEINECIAYADALRAEGIDARIVGEAVAQEEVKTSTRGPVQVRVERVTHHAMLDDILEPVQEEGAIEGTYETLGDLNTSQTILSKVVHYFPLEVDMVTSKSIKSRMYTFSPMMVVNSRKHHCRVRSYTREVLVISTNLDIQKNHYPLDFRDRRGDEARIKNTWYNQGLVNECHQRTLKILLRL
ncbi:hypothetical protein Tco_1236791 [Tanacetum coccineum]